MQTNQIFLTLIDKNVFYDPIRVVKRHTPYIEIRDDPRFVIVYYSDSGAEREDDGEVSIDTHANPEFSESFLVEAASPPRRKIHELSPDEYGVYRDE
ncbi:hypothetical protein F2Q69_00014670 [Brassica cretica]|uniref:Uncharacterized protein n=1 Tax=Brassica cretica TaxID=69181 RepID=A0A8S9R155_BRACR|nr:hypothetical protein F2Q69_00014670 [Brassica cretica]